MNYGREGLTLAYDDFGTGPAVVLVHGFPLNRQMWRPQAMALTAAGFRLIAPDLRGFGESEAGAGAYSMDTFADDVVALLDHLDVRKAVIGGMSMGGYVLLNLLARHPERVAAPCFIVTRSGADDEIGKAKRAAMAEEVKKLGPQVAADVFAKVLFAEESLRSKPELVAQVAAWMQQANPGGLSGGLWAMRDRPDSTPLLSQLETPALVIGAAEDRAMARENFDIFVDQLPQASNCLISDAGHMVNMEKPAEFNACLLKFLQGLKIDEFNL